MDKGIGFNRRIELEWLDAAAALRRETAEPGEIRARLEPVIGQRISSPTNIRKSIDILLNIWHKSAEVAPELHCRALELVWHSQSPQERLWLHYGLTMVTYPFFRRVVAEIGQVSRFGDDFTPSEVGRRVAAELGGLGSLEKAVYRVVVSLHDWEILEESERTHAYQALRGRLATDQQELEAWLLAAALQAHPAQELPAPDLLNLPELFPFRLTLTANDLRRLPGFELHRQGLGMEMVTSVSSKQ